MSGKAKSTLFIAVATIVVLAVNSSLAAEAINPKNLGIGEAIKGLPSGLCSEPTINWGMLLSIIGVVIGITIIVVGIIKGQKRAKGNT